MLKKAIERAGLAAMEMIALQLKGEGKYLSRSLSFDGMVTDTLHITLTQDQRRFYDDCCELWSYIISHHIGNKKTLWGKHLHFFRILVTVMKMPSLIRYIQALLLDKEKIKMQN